MGYFESGWGRFGSWWDSHVVHGGINTSSWIPAKGSVEVGPAKFKWDESGGGILTNLTGQDEEDYLKYGAILLGVYVIMTKWK